MAAILTASLMAGGAARADQADANAAPADAAAAKPQNAAGENTSDIAASKKSAGDVSGQLKEKASKSDAGAPKLFDCSAVWSGANCGIIIGPLFSTSKRGMTASVVNKVVRVSTDSSVNVSAFAEAHAFIIDHGWLKQGPFVAVGSATNNGFSAGLGWMFGLCPKPNGGARNTDCNTRSNGTPITISLGYIWSPYVQVLGDDIHANRGLPNNETEIRYKTTTTSGVLLAFGVQF